MDSAVEQSLTHGHAIDITTRGRQTGQPRRIELVFHNFGGRIFLSGKPFPRRRSWIANLDADPHFIFHLKDPGAEVDLPATGRVITDAAERRTILVQVAAAWGRSDIDEMVANSPLVEVNLAGVPA
jgi:deazaflavin-dependent oxidoreductase (nitroreductase family)